MKKAFDKFWEYVLAIGGLIMLCFMYLSKSEKQIHDELVRSDERSKASEKGLEEAEEAQSYIEIKKKEAQEDTDSEIKEADETLRETLKKIKDEHEERESEIDNDSAGDMGVDESEDF